MTVETAGALGRYFETLYTLNQNIMALCGSDVIDRRSECEKRVDEVVMSIPRLVPYSINKKNSRYEIKQNDGLMRFSKDLTFLGDEYEKILQTHLDCLGKVMRIRNKLQHEMHGARIVGASSGNVDLFAVSYWINEQEIELCARELIDFVKDMNILFSRLQNIAKQFAHDNQYNNHPYCTRLYRFDFADFNRIFESDLLHIVGEALQPF